MQIIKEPSNAFGHSFRHHKFLKWISSNFGISTARTWCAILGGNASSRYYSERYAIQETFKRLYKQFCEEAGIDTSDIEYDNLDKEEEEVTYHTRKSTIKWNVIEAGEADTVINETDNTTVINETTNQQPGEADSETQNLKTIESSETAMRKEIERMIKEQIGVDLNEVESIEGRL